MLGMFSRDIISCKVALCEVRLNLHKVRLNQTSEKIKKLEFGCRGPLTNICTNLDIDLIFLSLDLDVDQIFLSSDLHLIFPSLDLDLIPLRIDLIF